MPDTDRVASTLAGIRDDNIDSYADGSTSDIPRLVAALEAVLKLADRTDNHGRTRSPLARETAKLIREAITAELAGKEASRA